MLRKLWPIVVSIAFGVAVGFLAGYYAADSRTGNWRATGDGRTIINDRSGELRVAATGETVEAFQKREQKEKEEDQLTKLASAELGAIAAADEIGAELAQETIMKVLYMRQRKGYAEPDIRHVKMMAPNWARYQLGRSDWNQIDWDLDSDDGSPAK